MWTLFREISLRHLKFSPLRTALVVFGIALGVCMLSGVLATNDSLLAAFEDMVDRVAGKADLTVAGSDSGIPSSLTGEIAEIEGVAHAAAMLEVSTHSADGRGGPLLVLGVDFLGDTFFLPFAQDGRSVVDDPLAFVNDPTAILVSERLAKDRGLHVGSSLPLVTTNGVVAFHVKGLLKDTGPAASFGGQVVVMFLDAAQVSFARGYAVDRIDVVVDPQFAVSDVQKRIQALVAGKANAEAPGGRTHRLVAALWAFRNGLNMSGFTSLGVGMFLIYNAVSVSVAQRRKEIGTLRALGVTKNGIVRLLCIEALAMALLGSVLGLLLARTLARAALDVLHDTVQRFFVPIHAPAPVLSAQIVLVGLTAGFLTTLVASYFPARTASRISPSEALRSARSTSFARSLPTLRFASIGVCVTALAALPSYYGGELNGYLAAGILSCGAPFFVPALVKALRRILLVPVELAAGVPGRLALDNVERALGRSSITVIALMLAVGLSLSVGAYAGSFESSLDEWIDGAAPADASVVAGSPLLDRKHRPFASSVLARLEGLPGLFAVNPVRSVGLDLNGRRVTLLATDTKTLEATATRRGRHRTVVEGPAEFSESALAEKPRVVISENLSQREHLHPGGRLTLSTAVGRESFEVYAVVVDYSSDQGWLMMDRKWFLAYWQDELIDCVDLSFAPGVNRDAVIHRLRERLSDTLDLFVTSHEELRSEMRSAASSMFSYAKAPELITLAVAIMGVIGTMLAAVIDRIREIGTLRAIGATRRQVVQSLVWESGFLGLSATLAGLLVGVPLGLVLLKVVGAAASGWSLPYHFPISTAVRISVLITNTAVLAGFLPGQRAAKLDVVEALAFDS
jgi:putative ABC transport system permease protein